MSNVLAALPPTTRRDAFLLAVVFLTTLLLFLHAPVSTVGDSKYSLLLTQNLLSKGSFVLDGYGIPHKPLVEDHGFYLDGDIYQIEVVNDHFYSYFPPGSSVLSAPFLLLANAFSKPVIRSDGQYSFNREVREQRLIASFLMALLAVVFFLTARPFLPAGWSALVALGGTLGTQVWSTASRALWTHTWGISLLGFAILLLCWHETGRRRLSPVLLATVLSWTYFVRPTNSLFIIGFTVYILLYHRAVFLVYAATGAAWFAGFVMYSEHHFGKFLPSYFQANRLETSHFREAFVGNLVSPSRGAFIYVPVSLFVIYLVLGYWKQQRHPRLAILAVLVSLCHLLAVSCFVPWYGGGCFGPRYTTELVPWFVLLAILGTQAALDYRADQGVSHRLATWRATLATGTFLLLVSVAINARGAYVVTTLLWNQRPIDVDVEPARVWDWRHPQILAGLVDPPLLAPLPLLDGRVAFGEQKNRNFLAYGWSGGDADFTWSEDHRATVAFALEDLRSNQLRLCFAPFVLPPKLLRQHVVVRLNGHVVGKIVAKIPEAREYTFPLPEGALQRENQLSFDLPDAAMPLDVSEGNDDGRLLGIALSWIELGASPAAPAK